MKMHTIHNFKNSFMFLRLKTCFYCNKRKLFKQMKACTVDGCSVTCHSKCLKARTKMLDNVQELSKDVENVATDGSDCCSNISDSSGSRRQSRKLHRHNRNYHYSNNNNTATASSQQLSSTGKQQAVVFATTEHCYHNPVSRNCSSAVSPDATALQTDLVSRLDTNLKVLHDKQIGLIKEATLNETLGVSLADRVKLVAEPQQVKKFTTHLQEVGYITSLLLNLSERLTRAESALLDLDADHPEKKALEEKKCKLTGQLEDAKDLKENIDRRGVLYRCRYLTADECSDFDHFIATKAKLLIDAREMSDNMHMVKEQLRALKETFEDKY